MPLIRLAAPAAHPISLDEALAHLRVDSDDDDTLIEGLIATATRLVEKTIERALVTQSWRLTLDAFEPRIKLPLPPLTRVDTVRFTASDGSEHILPPADYQVGKGEPAILAPAQCWPQTRRQLDAVSIDFTCGYGGPQEVEPPLRHAILLLVAHWYENREVMEVASMVNTLPFTVNSLLAPYQIWSLG